MEVRKQVGTDPRGMLLLLIGVLAEVGGPAVVAFTLQGFCVPLLCPKIIYSYVPIRLYAVYARTAVVRTAVQQSWV